MLCNPLAPCPICLETETDMHSRPWLLLFLSRWFVLNTIISHTPTSMLIDCLISLILRRVEGRDRHFLRLQDLPFKGPYLRARRLKSITPHYPFNPSPHASNH